MVEYIAAYARIHIPYSVCVVFIGQMTWGQICFTHLSHTLLHWAACFPPSNRLLHTMSRAIVAVGTVATEEPTNFLNE